MPSTPLFSYKYGQQSRTFAKEQEAFKAAIDNGLQPESVTLEAVEKAEREAEWLEKIT
jgi:hypothetical protein